MNTAAVPAWIPTFFVPFVTLSYPTDAPANPDSFPNSSYYETGYLDLCIIVSFIASMAVLRDAVRLCVLEPFARWRLTHNLKNTKRNQLLRQRKESGSKHNGSTNGHAADHLFVTEDQLRLTKSEERQMNRSVLRFAEQGWALIYYAIQCSWGIYVHYNLPTQLLDPSQGVWSGYPHFPLPAPIKFYYLNETAFYLHGIFILNAEAKRKDHWQMMTHHFVAVALMFLSYSWNYTRIGCLIMVLMDWCDVILPLAKMLKYLGGKLVCDILFGLFMVSWFITRHILFMVAIYSTYADLPRHLAFHWQPEIGHYMTNNIYLGFLALLTILQVLQMIWFSMVIKVAYRVVTGKGAEDTRSDEEGSDAEVDGKKNK